MPFVLSLTVDILKLRLRISFHGYSTYAFSLFIACPLFDRVVCLFSYWTVEDLYITWLFIFWWIISMSNILSQFVACFFFHFIYDVFQHIEVMNFIIVEFFNDFRYSLHLLVLFEVPWCCKYAFQYFMLKVDRCAINI